METDAFWHLMETARARATQSGTVDEALVDLLTSDTDDMAKLCGHRVRLVSV
ncbi:hypothetical protein OG900_22035 [Streptomyces sp. NBC_00433]